ncbi:MAG TPA: hypothetical protein VMP03_02710 [Methylomirabilota bacterium]|nr:hypothetical protein [Methylomirabilota bacterium]
MSGFPFQEDRPAPPPARRFTPRSVAEGIAVALIAAGVIMLMQPLSMTLYSWSFLVTLVGTVLFIVGSKFPG